MINLQDWLKNPVETLSLTAIIDTALCVGAGGSTGSLADKPIVRMADGKLLIPGSQLKGRLRHECEKLARGLDWPICESPTAETMCPQLAGFSDQEKAKFNRSYDGIEPDHQHHCLICQMFGNPALASRIVVDDLICAEDPENLPEVLRPGVTINRRRQTAEDKKLYFLETSPPNAQLKFKGSLHFQPNCPDYAKALILAALRHINALGGSKSAGLGWLTWKYPKDIKIEDEIWSKLLLKGK
ncbi:RAMP superfamily CRISPR-associated protein [Oscillatoria acuminata]|uniref:Putative RAMP superfamily protein probably involved in DNA repair n=1 Tax=Oscillatoria acuminata PCC 6304 TaxID=56110 RepID=K9TDE9_9CYAN|nr:RAMP superfamily CRISPR-associated protein [Oscillatoria acuminata]AFY80156.1 putative RAMP superfamily protein probably involved in DNA repair [Oscillatoria acuminata PCC 6304]